MPKASKSSASSGTRKKHARKAAGPPPEVFESSEKPKSKPSKKEIKKGLAPPPKKSYISPSKLRPTPVQVDPLDGLGLAAVLPPDLVVVLRRLAKKDIVTKTRALEELSAWVSKAREEDEEVSTSARIDGSLNVLMTVLPVWLYRYPALSIHPSRRIRYLSALFHESLLQVSTLRSAIFTFLLETGSETQISQVLGTWCLSAWDVDRGVAALGSRSWKEAVGAWQNQTESVGEDKRLILDDSTFTQSLLPFILITVMDPESTYAALNPSHPMTSGDSPSSSHIGPSRQSASPLRVAPSSSARRSVLSAETSSVAPSREDDQESTEDRKARLRVGAMGALKWIFDTHPPTPPLVSALHSLFLSSSFWSVLNHAARPPFLEAQYQSPVLNFDGTVELPIAASGVLEGFGTGQTIVRRAGWNIVHALMGDSGMTTTHFQWKDSLSEVDSCGLISSAILRSAFVEPDPLVRSSMWGPLLLYLTKIKNAWMLNLNFEHASHRKGSLDDSGSEPSVIEENMGLGTTKGDSIVSVVSSASGSAAYAEFLAFLTLGCNGSPIQGYPTVLVILSTIPPEILPSTLPALSEFFDALWAAIDGQALSTLATERVKGTDAFLGSWGECLLWTSGKLLKSVDFLSEPDSLVKGGTTDLGDAQDGVGQESIVAVARAVVKTQFEKLVGELGKGLRIDASIISGKVAIVLGKLEQVAPDLFEEAWMQVSSFAMATIGNPDDPARGEYALAFLAALHQHLSPEGPARQEVERLVIIIAMKAVTSCAGQSRYGEPTGRDQNVLVLLTMSAKVLERLMDKFEQVLNGDENFVNHIDELFHANIISLLSQPSLIISYLAHRSDIIRAVATWRLLLSTIGSSADVDLDTRLHVLDVLLDSSQLEGSPHWAKPRGGELDGLAGHALIKALDGDGLMLSLTERLLKRSDAFLDAVVTNNMVSTIFTTIGTYSQALLQDPSAPLKTLRSTLNLLLALERESTEILRTSVTALDVMPGIFLLAFVLPLCSPVEEELFVLDLSKQAWERWRERTDEDIRETVFEKITDAIKTLFTDTDVRPRPASLLHALHHIKIHTKPLVISEIIPTQSELDALLASTSANPIDSTLAVVEPLAPSSSSACASDRSSWNGSFDESGFSPYARSVSCLLHVMKSDRQFARENMWTLRHAMTLALFASEVLQVPRAASPVFRSKPKVSEIELRDISRQTQQIAAFLLISPGEETWHKEVVAVLAGKSSQLDRLDSMGDFVKLVFEASLGDGTVRDSRILHTVLQYILRSAGKDDADLWIELARSLEDKSLQTSLAISLAVTESATEPPKLDRYRNELASKVAGTPPNKANTTGLRLLRRLSAVAPDPESDVIFLPQQRAVYLVQALQKWMASDEDLIESVESEITLVLSHLTPILQNAQGAHWEFIMDMIESNIENSSFKDADTLVLLSRTLRLLTSIQYLSVSNKYLRQLWGERSRVVLVMIRDLLAVKVDSTSSSVPRAVCRRQALSIIQDLPGSLMDETTLSTMCHLLADSSVAVQKMAYQLLQQAAIKRTEHLVIEAGVDSDATAIELPPELMSLLQSSIDLEVDVIESNASSQDPLAYLLGWMILFDLFTDASLKIKTAYVDQMRNLNIIGRYFLPNIFELLGVGREGQKSFKLNAWSIDEYWTAFYDADAPQSLRLLAAHLYYRALRTVPSLVRTWWDELKDRQLLAAVTSFTSFHFSSVIIASELMHVKPSSSTPVAGEESLTDESFNIKVALAVHEVTATFTVDDHQMVIGVKLPAEYPLRPVEVRDIRRVAVPENLWRKWLFAVQQVVTSQNGRIVDALSLFKKYVSVHFEDQPECAICYSIISVVDRTLPAKPCKTCKYRFHSSCLYKWFNTSHSSSCPLCRSDMV